MSHPHQYSDELINAYLDGELDKEDRKAFVESMRNNPELSHRICQLEKVRGMVQIAYHEFDPVDSPSSVKTRHWTSSGVGIAASILMVVGLFTGWFSHQYLGKDEGLIELAQTIQSHAPVADHEPWRVLLHVSSDDPYRINTVLNEAEAILQHYEAEQRIVNIQILANGKGLNVLRDDKSDFAQRIAKMQKRYKNLVFLACAKAIERVESEKGVQVKLLPHTQVVPSAVNQVLNRQKEGWTYIKI